MKPLKPLNLLPRILIKDVGYIPTIEFPEDRLQRCIEMATEITRKRKDFFCVFVEEVEPNQYQLIEGIVNVAVFEAFKLLQIDEIQYVVRRKHPKPIEAHEEEKRTLRGVCIITGN